ncbi:uncharacterized protein LOC127103844 [Lathyrus oleraceus]|uniref:uncharacterized protein LOC127103844 n=1 Tax=Pisum sativum TaxID=3888 RepID=UPI0021CE3E0D|nr:uncharacterized protein LOC127103844 [Pisum sativum]
MSNTLKIDGHTEEAKKLRMFPFTLAEEAEEWFYSLPAGSITSWEEMEKAFLIEYFLASVFLRKRCQSKLEGVIDLKLETNKICIEDTIVAEVEKKLKAMNIGIQQVAQVQPTPTVFCEIYSGPHQTVYCFATPQQVEEIKFLKQNNPYSNTYNPGWKNHPNFSWKYQKGTAPQHGQYQTQYQQQQQQQTPKKVDW